MRVPTLTIYQSNQYQLNKSAEKLNEANYAVSSGKRINKPSDDPLGAMQVLSIESTLSYLDQLKRNLNTGELWLTDGETALNTVQDSILDAKDIALEMSNSTYDAGDRAAAAENIDQILMLLMDVANTRTNGQYLFAGIKTDTQPFVLDDPDNPSQVIYQGNDKQFMIKTGQNSTMSVGYTGCEVFGNTESGEDIFTLLIEMQDDLKSNDGDNLDYYIDALDTHFERVVDTVSNMGTKANTLETTRAAISDSSINLSGNKSNIEDADIIEAITDLQLQQTAYEAALSATSKIISLSLVDYM